MKDEAPERPLPPADPLPDCLMHYTTATASLLENAHGDKFVKIILPIYIEGQVMQGCTEAMVTELMVRSVLSAASKEAFRIECLGPAQVIREQGALPQCTLSPSLPPRPPLPERES